MRPGKDEKSFIERSLLISEDEIIRWREYNTLYQFVMRICLRLFDRSDEANIYVFDEWQAEHLRGRFALEGEASKPPRRRDRGRLRH